MNISSKSISSSDIYLFLFNFVLYSFFGWILEGLFSLASNGHFSRPGFLLGPFKPMYGFAMAFLILIKSYNPSIPFMTLMCFLIPTSIEYVSGYMLNKFFLARYWDYSSYALNINGYICPIFSIVWTVLAMLTIYMLQPYIVSAYTYFSFISVPASIIFSAYILIDFLTVVVLKSPHNHLT